MLWKKKTPREIFSEVVNHTLEPLARSMGFERHEVDGWCRRRGDAVAGINWGLRAVRGYDYAWLGVGIGVGYLSIARLLRKAPDDLGLGTLDRKAPSFIGALLRRLDPDSVDNEWLIEPGLSSRGLGKEVAACVHKIAIPFWERYQHLENAIESWAKPLEERPKYMDASADMHLAAAYFLRGDVQEALAFLEHRIKEWEDDYESTGQWSTRITAAERRKFLDFLREQADS